MWEMAGVGCGDGLFFYWVGGYYCIAVGVDCYSDVVDFAVPVFALFIYVAVFV
jgi:hypothetical protein